ncbi:hypothetical protein BD770DRAFT_381952 [Pilaira anomala]|nr:hypothetical protein BD770DRAFT_381952 [Pilaira anomala]
MLTTTALNQREEDFPVGFAEIKETSDEVNDDTVFYVEWFDNNSEFPSLSTTNDHNLTGGAWELLQRKEMNEEEDEHTLVPVEGDACWSKLSTPGSKELYANVAEKHAELKPTKRIIQPLWPNIDIKKKEQPKTQVDLEEDQPDLGDELITYRKLQSRRSNRMASRRKLHDLRTVDIHVEGIVRLATTRFGNTNITWVPYEKKPSCLDIEEQMMISKYFDIFDNSKILSKPAVLRYSSRFTHNVKEYAYKYTQRPAFRQAMVPDNCEFSALSKITSK